MLCDEVLEAEAETEAVYITATPEHPHYTTPAKAKAEALGVHMIPATPTPPVIVPRTHVPRVGNLTYTFGVVSRTNTSILGTINANVKKRASEADLVDAMFVSKRSRIDDGVATTRTCEQCACVVVYPVLCMCGGATECPTCHQVGHRAKVCHACLIQNASDVLKAQVQAAIFQDFIGKKIQCDYFDRVGDFMGFGTFRAANEDYSVLHLTLMNGNHIFMTRVGPYSYTSDLGITAQIINKDVLAARLVGIELNPGPLFTRVKITAHCEAVTKTFKVNVNYQSDANLHACMAAGVAHIQPFIQEMVKDYRAWEVTIVQYIGVARRKRSKYIIPMQSPEAITKAVEQARLVGIALNPGPNNEVGVQQAFSMITMGPITMTVPKPTVLTSQIVMNCKHNRHQWAATCSPCTECDCCVNGCATKESQMCEDCYHRSDSEASEASGDESEAEADVLPMQLAPRLTQSKKKRKRTFSTKRKKKKVLVGIHPHPGPTDREMRISKREAIKTQCVLCHGPNGAYCVWCKNICCSNCHSVAVDHCHRMIDDYYHYIWFDCPGCGVRMSTFSINVKAIRSPCHPCRLRLVCIHPHPGPMELWFFLFIYFLGLLCYIAMVQADQQRILILAKLTQLQHSLNQIHIFLSKQQSINKSVRLY
jgi:hypothetical protein